MLSYALRRVVLGIPTLFLVALVTFALVRLQPGNVLTVLAGEGMLSPSDAAKIAQGLGLDRPAPMQFLIWLRDILQGDFGRSFYTGQDVSSLFLRRTAITVQLGVMAVGVAALIGIPMGTASGYWKGSLIDYATRGVAVVGLTVPHFWLGLIVMALLIRWFGWLPPLSYQSFLENPRANLLQLVFPVLIVAYRMSAVVMRMTRSIVLETISQDYIRTARAKGLSESRVLLRHVSRNALIPIITIIGLQFASAINGIVVIEVLFGLPGLGSLVLDAANSRDYPILQAVMLLFAMSTMVTNLIVDLSYGILDPRVR